MDEDFVDTAEKAVNEVENDGNEDLVENGEKPVNEVKDNSNAGKSIEESLRIKITNIPGSLQYVQVKQLLSKNLPGVALKKLKHSNGVAYVTLPNTDDTQTAIDIFNGFEVKGKKLDAKRVAMEQIVNRPPREIIEKTGSSTANEISAPLANVPYEEQLKLKYEEVKKTFNSLTKQLHNANVPNTRYLQIKTLLQPIVRSPVLTNYRNKCEFTIGADANNEPCIGFVAGNMAKKTCVVVPINDSILVTENMRKVCEAFTEIVKESGLPVFDEFERTGFWKTLAIRDFSGDCMLCFTVQPQPESEQEKVKAVKDKILSTFIKFGNMNEYQFNVRSIYWQTQNHSSDPVSYDHIGGVPYVYETILGVRFRISPYTFFQTNTRSASLLYEVVGNFLGLPNSNPLITDQKDNEHLIDPSKSIYLVDICCGAGTIGQCMLRRIETSIQYGKFSGNYSCIGVELVDQAVQDARRNAEENGFSTDKCRYISGEAEVVFRFLTQHFNIDPKDENAMLMGVLDPPRAGLSKKVIISCRKLEKMKRLVYVSCDFRQAIENIVDLCRPESKKYDGEPFKIKAICPVDMFPQTNHLECVILLTR